MFQYILWYPLNYLLNSIVSSRLSFEFCHISAGLEKDAVR